MMRKLFFSFLFLLQALLAGVLAEENAAQRLVDLTPGNFDEVVNGSRPALVKFYAPWCGHCQSMEGAYRQLAEYFDGKSVVIAQVDANKHSSLRDRFGIEGYPTLLWFPRSSGSPRKESYTGRRDFKSMRSFIESKIGAKSSTDSSASSKVAVQLTASNFDSVVQDSEKCVLVEFYAPWCGHCKHLDPTYQKLAKSFRAEKDVVIAQVDCDAYQEIASKYNIEGFPTIKLFPKGASKKPIEYQGGRSLEELVDFVNQKADKHRKSDGRLPQDYGLIKEMDDLAKELISNPQKRDAVFEMVGSKARSIKDFSSAYYAKVLEKIDAQGASFISAEVDRLSRVLDSESLEPEKMDEFQIRKNILSRIAEIADVKLKERKQEL